MMRRLLPLLALVLGACGYTDAGSGTRTLQVQATSAFDVGGNDSRMHVQVQRGTDYVPDATVQVKDGDTGEVFTLTLDGNGRRYSVSIPGYRRRLELAIKAGTDQLDVKLEGPGPHTITKPAAGALSRSGDTLGVEWATRDGVAADEVALVVEENHQLDRTLTSDTGSSHDIPLSLMPAGGYHLDVTRLNRVAPAGAVAGSTFEITYGVGTEFNLD